MSKDWMNADSAAGGPFAVRDALSSPLQAALRFHVGRPMIYSTIAKKTFIQINDSLADPMFTEVEQVFVQEYLGYDDWEPWDEGLRWRRNRRRKAEHKRKASHLPSSRLRHIDLRAD